jgi:hypothetical protein
VVSVNHPKPFGPAWEYDIVGPAHAIEVWNGPWGGLNIASLEFWDSRLRAGQRLVAVGGSDTHVLRGTDPDSRHAPMLGCPTTWVETGPRAEVAAILGAIRAGRTFVSESPSGPQLYLDRSDDSLVVGVVDGGAAAVHLVADQGIVAVAAVDAADWSRVFTVPRDVRYVRAQLVGSSGEMRALTSPIWFDRSTVASPRLVSPG